MCPAVEPALNGQYFSILFASVCLLRTSLMNAGRFWGAFEEGEEIPKGRNHGK